MDKCARPLSFEDRKRLKPERGTEMIEKVHGAPGVLGRQKSSNFFTNEHYPLDVLVPHGLMSEKKHNVIKESYTKGRTSS